MVLDDVIATDMTFVFSFIARVSMYSDSLGYKDDFIAIMRAWRPNLVD